MNDEPRRAAEAWLRKADADLRAIRILMADDAPPLDIACFHAQQAAEKALKALLTAGRVPFPKTHDLALLASLVPHDAALDIPRGDWVELSYFAVSPRYPDDLTDYTRPLADALADKAHAVYAAVQRHLKP